MRVEMRGRATKMSEVEIACELIEDGDRLDRR